MGVTVTACGRVIPERPPDAARLLADLLPDGQLEQIVRFILDGGRGDVILGVRDRGIIGARINLILF